MCILKQSQKGVNFYMKINEFSELMKLEFNAIGASINKEQIEKFYRYMEILLEWNQKMNLTAIVEPKEVILKHFVDSITIEGYIAQNAQVIDIGTGAGFPGIPLKLVRNDLNITLMDSLNKRITFLEEVVNKLKLTNIDAIHSRAEELAKNKDYREKFDVATSRAVAPLNVLLEYMLPFVKVNGICICMKGSSIENEIQESRKCLELLGGKIEKIDSFELHENSHARNIIIVRKIKNTPNKYPRKAGMPTKEPIR